MFNNLQLGFATISYNKIEITQAAYDAADRFFACSLEYKKKFLSLEAGEPGYCYLSNKEFFTLADSNIPPELAPCLDYLHMVYHLARSSLLTIAEKLDLPHDNLLNLIQDSPFPEISPSMLRIFSYQPTPQNNIKKIFSADAHQDFSLITLVPASAYPALEVFDYSEKGRWLSLEEKLSTNEMLVMVGEFLNKITHGYLLSATHRVKNVSKPRISLVYHLNPKPGALLDSSVFKSRIIGSASKPFYLTAKEFMSNEIKNSQSINE